jgi:hypothetical protein
LPAVAVTKIAVLHMSCSHFETSSTEGNCSVTIVRVGATQSYSEGWEAAFGKAKRVKTAAPTKSKAAAPKAKKAAKKAKKK